MLGGGVAALRRRARQDADLLRRRRRDPLRHRSSSRSGRSTSSRRPSERVARSVSTERGAAGAPLASTVAAWRSPSRPSHRGGSGPPLVCLHGFTDTWRTWELVLPSLERRYDVLAPTLAGHAGGPPLAGAAGRRRARRRGRARRWTTAGFETAHLAGNSLGGFVALQLAARGRARSVVALAPAGGWADGRRLVPRDARPVHGDAGAGAGGRAVRRRDRRPTRTCAARRPS